MANSRQKIQIAYHDEHADRSVNVISKNGYPAHDFQGIMTGTKETDDGFTVTVRDQDDNYFDVHKSQLEYRTT